MTILSESVDLIWKAADQLEKQAQATFSGPTLSDTLRKISGLTSAFISTVRKYPNHPNNFSLVVDINLVPEQKDPPEGTPPGKWVPRYDRVKSKVSVYVKLQSGEILPLGGFDKKALVTLFKFYETPTSNPNPRGAIQRALVIQEKIEIEEATL